MKKILCLIAVAAVAGAACSANKNASADRRYAAGGADNAGFANAANQIVDQEFDNMLAPETDYDNIPAYELQACGESYLPPVEGDAAGSAAAAGAAKAKGTAKSTVSTRAKRVTNTTNIYYVDGPNPDVPVSSTTTTKTVYSNGTVTSSTSSSSNTKTTTNADGSVTTTSVSY